MSEDVRFDNKAIDYSWSFAMLFFKKAEKKQILILQRRFKVFIESKIALINSSMPPKCQENYNDECAFMIATLYFYNHFAF